MKDYAYNPIDSKVPIVKSALLLPHIVLTYITRSGMIYIPTIRCICCDILQGKTFKKPPRKCNESTTEHAKGKAGKKNEVDEEAGGKR